MLAIEEAAYDVQIAWDNAVSGYLLLGTSTLGSTDTLAPNSWSQKFGGPYSVLTDPVNSPGIRVEEIDISRGRSDDLQTVDMGTCTVTVVDPAGVLNPKNPASPLAGKLRPMRPARVDAYYAREQIANGDFAIDLLGWIGFWNAPVRDTAVWYTAPGSLRYDATVLGDTVRYTTGNLSAKALSHYTFRVYVKGEAGKAVSLRWDEVGGGIYRRTINSGPYAMTGDWQLLTLTGYTGVDTDAIEVYVYNETAGPHSFHIDEASLRGDPDTYALFYGFVRTISYQPGGRLGTATIELGDLFVWLDTPRDDTPGGAPLPVIATMTGTTTGAVIAAILNAIDWTDQAMRIIEAGDTVPSFAEANGQATPLSLISNLLQAERGICYVDRLGRVVYETRNTRQTRPVYAAIDSEMQEIAPGTSLDNIINRWVVTRTPAGGATGPQQIAEDPASENEFGVRAQNLDSPYFASDSVALTIGQLLLSRTKDPQSPIWRLNIDNRSPVQFRAALAAELQQRMTLAEAKTGTRGDYFIEQLTHTISAADRSHKTSMVLTERTAHDLAIVGTTTLGNSDVLGA